MENNKLALKETVIYLRVSTQEQNVLNQLKDCESIRPKDKKTDTFIDYTLLQDKQSAFLDFKDRKSFDFLVSLIKKKKLKFLIVWDLDRIYRNRKKLLSFFVLCKIYNCRVYSFRQQWLNTLSDIQPPFNEIMFDFMLNIMGWIAEDESIKKSERVKSSITKRKGITISKFGNIWGRKPISTRKKNMVLGEKSNNPTISIRQLSKLYKLSTGSVHKILSKNQ